MPIYAYRCTACGHARDVLQKLSDPLLSVCPACGAQAFEKQVTAAGFQLKGSGWYVTDFRGGNKATGEKSDSADKAGPNAAAPAPKAEAAGADKPAASPAPAASPGPAPAPAPSTPTASGS